jgi:hypothetical protein
LSFTLQVEKKAVRNERYLFYSLDQHNIKKIDEVEQLTTGCLKVHSHETLNLEREKLNRIKYMYFILVFYNSYRFS